jgi:hypothetical protein
MHAVRAPDVTEIAAVSDRSPDEAAVRADVVDDEIRRAIRGDSGTDPHQERKLVDSGTDEDHPNRRGREQNREPIVGVERLRGRTMMKAVPSVPRPVHDQPMHHCREHFHREERGGRKQERGHDAFRARRR